MTKRRQRRSTSPRRLQTLTQSAKENLACITERLGDQVKGNTQKLSQQMSNNMFKRFDNEEDEDEDEHGVHHDAAGDLRKEVAGLSQRHNIDPVLAREFAELIERAKALGSPETHGHHDEGPMPWMSMPTVLSRHGEPQPELHVGWADIYLDLILVGVAFNGAGCSSNMPSTSAFQWTVRTDRTRLTVDG